MGIRDRPIAPRSPWQNAYVERLIGTIRRECLDHMIVFGETHSLSRSEATTRLSTIRTTEDRADDASPAVRDAMLAAVPSLRAFAISLSGNVDRADDLVQETLLRAIAPPAQPQLL